MTAKPRKGRVATFSSEDDTAEAHGPSSVTGLRFSIVARSGGTAQLDFIDLRPRPLAIDAAQAIRRLAEVGGPLGARSTVMAYANAIRIFFAFLASEAPNLTMSCQVEDAHIDEFEDWLDADGKSRVHAFTILSKIVVVFREIDADQPDRVSQSLRARWRYTSARRFERPRPRDAYSPYVARQLRNSARADVAALMRRIDEKLPKTLVAHVDPVIRQRAFTVHEAVVRCGFLPRNDNVSAALYRALYSCRLPTASLLDGIYARFYLTTHDLPPLLTLLSLDTGLERSCPHVSRGHPGRLLFDPASALCLKAATDQSKPQTALCQPTKCPNACIRARQLPVWQRAEADVKAMLKEKRLSDAQRSVLKAERERIRDVIRGG